MDSRAPAWSNKGGRTGASVAGRFRAAVDIGTTAVKAALVGEDGRVHARHAETYPTRRPAPGHVEQDPSDWLALTRRALAALDAAANGGEVAALALTAQVNTHAFVDAAGGPLLPALTWADTRAAAEAAELSAGLDPADIARWLGGPVPLDASHALPRMLWLARRHPALWDRCAAMLLPKDFVLRHLLGAAVADPLSCVGLVGADLRYAAPLVDAVAGAADRLPPLAAPDAVVGRLPAGEPLAGVPVACGTMDAWAALVGLGAAREGAQVWLSGTSEVPAASAAAVNPAAGAVVFPALWGIRVHAAPTQAGGEAARWCAALLGHPLEDLAALAAATPAGPDVPLFLPQIEGERAPLWNPALRGAFLGLSHRAGPGHVARAVFEGVALAARHAAGAVRASAGLAPGPMLCGGGGFRAAAWARIRADVMGVPLRVMDEGEPGVTGAALIAAVAAGDHDSLAGAWAATARFGPAIDPDPRAAARYDALFSVYTEAIGAADAVTRRLATL